MKKKNIKNNKKQVKNIIEYITIRIIAFLVFNFPIFGYVLACYLTSNI